MGSKFAEIASIKGGRDWTRGWVGAMASWLPNTDSLLELKSGGDLKLYEQVAQDDRVKSCLQQRFRALISHEWEVMPASDKRGDRKVAEFVSSQLQALEWDSVVEMMLWGVFYGYSVAEVLWEPQGDKVGIAQIRVRNRRRFVFDEDQMPRLRTVSSPLGEALPERKFWYFATGADNSDEPYGRGLAHWLYWLVFFKKNDFRWWIRFLELFAQPARKGTYPASATDTEKGILWQGLSAFGVDSQIMLPEGLAMEFLEASRTGTPDYQAMLDQCNSAIATVIMSQNMTTEDGSSLSQAQVHAGVAASIVEADADLLCASFNRSVVRWLCDYNFPSLTEYPQLQYKLESAPDLKSLADRDKTLADMGFPPSEKHIVETYGEGFQQDPALAKNSRLNSGQITALSGLLTQATQSSWSAETLQTALAIAFPQVSSEQAAKLAELIAASATDGQTGNPQAPASPPESTTEDLSTLFASGLAEGTIKKIKGQEYRLTSSRWRRVDDGQDLITGIKPRSLEAVQAEVRQSTSPERLAHIQKRHEGLAETMRANDFPESEVDKHEQVAAIAESKRSGIESRSDRAKLALELEATKPYSVAENDLGFVITKGAHTIDLPGIAIEQSPRSIALNLAEGTVRMGAGQAVARTADKAETISQLPEEYWFDRDQIPHLNTKASQIEVHEFLHGDSTFPGILRKPDGRRAQFSANPDPIAQLATTMQAQDHFRPWLEQIQDLLNNSGNLAEFQAALESTFPDLDPADFRQAMIEAATAASLGGYFESSQD
jgi:phage gp29-like protein